MPRGRLLTDIANEKFQVSDIDIRVILFLNHSYFPIPRRGRRNLFPGPETRRTTQCNIRGVSNFVLAGILQKNLGLLADRHQEVHPQVNFFSFRYRIIGDFGNAFVFRFSLLGNLLAKLVLNWNYTLTFPLK